jgi:hypothetical protein
VNPKPSVVGEQLGDFNKTDNCQVYPRSKR